MKNNLYDIFADSWLKDCDSVWLYSDPHFGDFESYQLRFSDEYIRLKEQKMKVIEKKDKELGLGSFFLVPVLDFNDWIHELDEMQIKNINSKAGKNSCLIILGDVGNVECVKKLKAKKKILILGNHDKGASNYKRTVKLKQFKYDDSDNETTLKLEEEAIKQGFKLEGCTQFIDHLENRYSLDNHLFDEVYEGPLMINDRLILSHEPIDVPDYMFNIHGHCHELPYCYDAKHRNVCAEALDYTPISLTKLLKIGVLKNTKSIHRDYIDNRLETLAKEGSD